ncbi:MAG: VanZ family protein [Planctomycetota bacterium]|jgi:VanZ family protein
MYLSLRQKVIVVLLLIYWPALFILAHIPIPQLVYRAQVSDKSLHVLAYLILVFLLGFAIGSEERVNLRKGTIWWVLAAVVGYAVIDEWLQGYVGRMCDITDFLANLAGVLTGLILFAFLTFWPALLVVTGIAVFLLTNLARANPAELLPVTSVLFYLFGYGFFTLLWVRHLHFSLSLKAPEPKWLAAASALPAGFLLTVKLFSIILGKTFAMSSVILSAVGIAAVVFTVFLAALFRRYSGRGLSPGSFERRV